MRRLLLLVGAIVFVDTMFFAALTPLLPQYAEELELSKAGAGLLAASYALGALVGGIPGGMSAARFGVRPTVLIGLTGMAITTVTFGFADSIWLLDTARFLQGVASSFSWTASLAWLVAAAPAERRGETIGAAMGAAIVGALFGPVLGGIASVVGTGPAFASVAVLASVLGVAAWRTPAYTPEHPQPLGRLFGALRDRAILASIWFVLVPALLFGAVNVLGPLRLDVLGLSALAIGAIVPLIPYLLGYESLWAGVICGGIGLAIAGGVAARFTSRPLWWASLRQLVFGGIAIGATYLVGTLVASL